jgi:NAD(P)-dependent dehydrogenase (short-subunit alcohol dehydrogenase family)
MIKPSADTLSTSTPDAFDTSFAVNATGVFLLTQALIPNLTAASPPAKIAIMSSRVGSMADNSSGGAYAYRASKAAVNSVGVSLAMDLKEKGIAVFLLHPGINDTNLGGGMKGYPGLIEPKVTAERFVKLLGEWGINETGKFFQYEGNELPW